MTEDQTRSLDISDCASRMLEASSEFLALQARCRELVALVQAESDFPAGEQSTHTLTGGLSREPVRMIGMAYERLSQVVALIVGKMLSLSTFVSSSRLLDRPLIMAPKGSEAATVAMESLSNNHDDQYCFDEKEDNSLMEIY